MLMQMFKSMDLQEDTMRMIESDLNRGQTDEAMKVLDS